MAALDRTASGRRGVGEVDGNRAHDIFRLQTLANLSRQRYRGDLESPPERFEPGTEPRKRAARKALHIVTPADCGEALVPLGQHLVGLDASLGKDSPVLFCLRLRVLPMALEQLELPALNNTGAAPPPQEYRLEQRLRERVALVRHGHRDAEFLPDTGRLAQDDLEYRTIHRVVDAVDERGAHRFARLTEAIDTALALLMACRVPREVVVNDGVEVLLQVDALRQAVGGDQDPGAFGHADPRHTLPHAL